jgi:hypothetical protein
LLDDKTNQLRVIIVFYYRAVEGFSNAELSSAVASDLFGNLDQVFSSSENWIEKKFAVRSSAVGEDSSDLSSAGQNETFLGCSGKNRIEEAVLKCWASLFAFQSVEYRRYNEVSFEKLLTFFVVIGNFTITFFLYYCPVSLIFHAFLMDYHIFEHLDAVQFLKFI